MKCWIFYIGFVLLLIGCKPKPAAYPQGDFRILILADTQTSDDEDKYNRLGNMLDRVNNDEFPGVDFVAVSGDFVSAVYGDDTNSENRLQRTVAMFKDLSVPYYPAMGNHDYKLTRHVDSDAPFDQYDIEKMEEIWKKYSGFEPYYAIEHKEWNFIVLNSMRGRYLQRAFDDEQMDWFKSELEKKLPTILIFHHPIKTDHFKAWAKPKDLITAELEPDFFNYCKEYQDQIKGIFVGHGHRWERDILFDKIPVYETAGFADADGEPHTVVGFYNNNHTIEVAQYPK